MTARNTMKTIAITLAAMGTAIAPAAFATSADDVSVTIKASYLNTETGVVKVYDALADKAETACTTNTRRSLSAQAVERDCMSNLLDDFIESADHDKLTSYHESVIS